MIGLAGPAQSDDGYMYIHRSHSCYIPTGAVMQYLYTSQSHFACTVSLYRGTLEMCGHVTKPLHCCPGEQGTYPQSTTEQFHRELSAHGGTLPQVYTYVLFMYYCMYVCISFEVTERQGITITTVDCNVPISYILPPPQASEGHCTLY